MSDELLSVSGSDEEQIVAAVAYCAARNEQRQAKRWGRSKQRALDMAKHQKNAKAVVPHVLEYCRHCLAPSDTAEIAIPMCKTFVRQRMAETYGLFGLTWISVIAFIVELIIRAYFSGGLNDWQKAEQSRIGGG